MSAYIVVATGSVFAYPKEQSAISATEAEVHCLALRRLCGRRGKVQVFGVKGREISWATLERLAAAERNQSPV